MKTGKNIFAFIRCMAGYTDYTLTTANMSDAKVHQDFYPEQMMQGGVNITQCR